MNGPLLYSSSRQALYCWRVQKLHDFRVNNSSVIITVRYCETDINVLTQNMQDIFQLLYDIVRYFRDLVLHAIEVYIRQLEYFINICIN